MVIFYINLRQNHVKNNSSMFSITVNVCLTEIISSFINIWEANILYWYSKLANSVPTFELLTSVDAWEYVQNTFRKLGHLKL